MFANMTLDLTKWFCQLTVSADKFLPALLQTRRTETNNCFCKDYFTNLNLIYDTARLKNHTKNVQKHDFFPPGLQTV